MPVGINILNVDKIDSEQEDYNYLLDETNMILNVNTIEDYYICKEILNQKRSTINATSHQLKRKKLS